MKLRDCTMMADVRRWFDDNAENLLSEMTWLDVMEIYLAALTGMLSQEKPSTSRSVQYATEFTIASLASLAGDVELTGDIVKAKFHHEFSRRSSALRA